LSLTSAEDPANFSLFWGKVKIFVWRTLCVFVTGHGVGEEADGALIDREKNEKKPFLGGLTNPLEGLP